ncbi:META domain-containing protein [Pontibacter oryzae]|uniref:META domain-containing protein n=1 Tax=Pontibacter oryzae TaxID=2304593 RepID=A0A399RQI7_9BACT|nr:META domain-containing protein [Pontibacter oryzae]RIJ34080.1 META domain-containing protein [Pontibacter oryzae]
MKKLLRLLSFLLVTLWLGSGCTVQNKDLAGEVESIKDAYWSLVSLEGQDMQQPQNTKTAFIRFQERDDDVHGFTGCNKFFGKYEANEKNLVLSELGTTRMACPDMEQENKFLEVLGRVDSYRLSDNILTLYARGKAVATFMTGTEQSIDNTVPEDVNIGIDSVGIY